MMTMHASLSDEGIFGTSRKISLTTATFLGYIIPPLVCLYFMGVLAQLEGTRFYRLALLPVLVWLAWRGMFVDMSGGDPKQSQLNVVLMTDMVSFSMRAIVWAVAREPFQRQSPSSKANKSDPEKLYTALWNAWDLMFNVRGIGWNWPRGLVLPKPTFETESRTVFVLLSMVPLALYAFCADASIQIIRILGPDSFGSFNGGSLFDHTLPPLLELMRAFLVSFLVVWMVYFTLQWSYHFLSIICIILFQQRPSQWPPLFDSPWLSTSLAEFWGRRWHQMMRELLVTLAMSPSSYLFGPLGGVLGAFLFSGIFHDIELRAFGRGGNSAAVVGPWVMNGVGIVLERMWTKTTGRRVGGFWGWMWTFGWLGLWGVWIVDAWAVAGRFGTLSLPGGFEPSVVLAQFVRGCLS